MTNKASFSGRVYVVGTGIQRGELGVEDNFPSITHPIHIHKLRDEPITDIASGRFHTIAINTKGKVIHL